MIVVFILSFCILAVCSTSGSSHYYTFDGSYYSVETSCKYTLVKSINGTAGSSFAINIQNAKCGSTQSVCTKNIDIIMNGIPVAKLRRGSHLQVANITRTDNEFSAKGLVITQRSFWTMVYLNNEKLAVYWDGGRFTFYSPVCNRIQSGFVFILNTVNMVIFCMLEIFRYFGKSKKKLKFFHHKNNSKLCFIRKNW